MANIWGYARCSTNETLQDVERQVRDLLLMGVPRKHVFSEYASGASKTRKELNKLFDAVSAGDTVCVTDVSRLSRSLQHLNEIIDLVQEKKLCLRIGETELDCRSKDPDPMTRGMIMMMGMVADLERQMISRNIKSGIANARAKGARLGRPRLRYDQIPSGFFTALPLYRSGKLTITEIAKLLDKPRPTIYKYIRMEEEHAAAEAAAAATSEAVV